MARLKQIEDFLKEKIFPELEKGRPDFDKPHTKATVKKLKEILNYSLHLKVDKIVLIIAAYAHDWGYADLFNQGKPVNFKEVTKAKTVHMKFGAQKLKSLLKDDFFDFLSDPQKKRAIHLVKVHDNLKDLKSVDELILMEADVLGATDVKLVKPTFDFESNEKWIKKVKKKRLPLFINDFSKKELLRLLKERMRHYEEQLKV